MLSISGVYLKMMAEVLESHLMKWFAWIKIAKGLRYTSVSSLYYPAIQLLIAIVILPKIRQARGTYYVNVEKLGNGAHWRRTYGQQVYSPFLLAFTHEVHSLTLSTFLLCVFMPSKLTIYSCYRMRQARNPTMWPKVV